MSSPAALRPRGLVPALLILLLVPGAALATSLFPNPVYDVGFIPVAILSADLNGDGRPDLISVNGASGDVSILLAREGGEFAPELRVPVEPDPWAGAAGDFNGDGNMDVVVCGTEAPSDLAILLGRGDGTFQPPAFISSLGDCSDILVTDLNNDGKADVAMVSRTLWSVTLFLGRGDGTFDPGLGIGPASGPGNVNPVSTAMAMADFNRDGKPDLAVGSHETAVLAAGTVTLLLGDGNGSFTQGVNVSTSSGVMDLVAADFNRDGKPDLATVNAAGGFSIILGRGDGTFQAPGEISAAPDFPFSLIAGDFDSDGRIDLAAGDSSSHSVLVLPGRGDGTFEPALRSAAGGSPAALVSGDFDGDGRIDLANADGWGDSVAVLPGHGDGTFGPLPRWPVGSCPQSLASGDFNRDGKPDLVTANNCSDDVSVLLGRGDGTFEPQVLYGMGSAPRTVVVADFNGDGIPDLATANRGTPEISVRLGLGDGSFGSEDRVPLPDVHRGSSFLVSADFNRDGRADLATAPVGLPYPYVGGIYILLGLGNGSFAPPTLVPWLGGPLLAVDDFNRDGVPDLATTGKSPSPAVFLGQGDGTFAPPAQDSGIPSDFVPRALAAGNLDEDGNPDEVISMGPIRSGLFVFHGAGDGTFGSFEAYPAPEDALAVVIADIDGDRRNDLVVAENRGNDVRFLSNAGGGMFAPASRFLAGYAPTALVAVDLNGDGWTDLVTANGKGNDVLVMLSRGIPGVVPSRPPVADAGADATVECASPSGAVAHLDGSGSSDPDSTPGTDDDIVSFEWFEGYGGPGQALLGTGVTLAVTLPLGVHTITLKVTDRAGASATDSVTLTVADTTSPSLLLSVSPAILWPPNGRMAGIHATAEGADSCGPITLVLESIVESDSGAGAGNGGGGDVQGAALGSPDLDFSLRAARSGTGTGRTYAVTYRATDGSGNVTRSSATVLVPHDRGDIAPGSLRTRRARPADPPWDPSQLQAPAP